VAGSEDAIRDEMRQALKAVTGEEGERKRERLEDLRRKVMEDGEKGDARKTMNDLGHLI